jgi:transcriptional regulator with XRE-family HTH domain
MDARHAELLEQTDREALGRRLRSARLARGLTQSQVAHTIMSVAYLSRIEAGHRGPTYPLLVSLAERLDVTVESLLGEPERRVVDEIRLALDYAELSLESGQPEDAETHLKGALAQLETSRVDGMRDRARLLHARALEATHREDDAILELEELIDDGSSDGLTRIRAGIALCRIYRQTGDLGRAVECGERVMTYVEAAGLGACEEAVQLAVTVSAAYSDRGDTGHAVRMCTKAISRAESLGSSKARASAYWNASIMQAERGDPVAAVSLAERALALMGEGQDARNLARLRGVVGRLQLELDPPSLDEARHNLEQAVVDMRWSASTPSDRTWALLGLARAEFLSGDVPAGRDLVAQVHDLSDGRLPLAEAEAWALQGSMHAAEGDSTAASSCFQRAVLTLSAIGADRAAAQLWFDLADLLTSVGMIEAASDAYRRAAASTGLRASAASATLARR